MKKRITKVLCLTLALAMLLSVNAMAATPASTLTVRMNGEPVAFQGAQPCLDKDGKALLPLDYVNAKLGGKNVKNIPTVNVDGQTYVPIREAAELLGIYVDYSSVYKTVGIYKDVLTSEQIKTLRAYPYTRPDGAVSYADAKSRLDAATLAFRYGTCRDSFTEFANAHAHLYHTLDRGGKYYFPSLDKTLNGASSQIFYETVLKEAVAEVSYSSKRLKVEFLADNSCVHQSDSLDSITTCVRGIVKIRLSADPRDLTAEEVLMLCKLGFTQLNKGKDQYIPVDVHMNTSPSYLVNIHTVVPLDKSY